MNSKVNMNGWTDLDCGARIRCEEGEPCEVAMPEGAWGADDKTIRKIAREVYVDLQVIGGAVYKRPGDDRIRAMVCNGDLEIRVTR